MITTAPAPVDQLLARTAKIAHELSNVLGAIGMYSELLVETHEEAQRREDVQQILVSVARGRTLSAQLQSLGNSL